MPIMTKQLKGPVYCMAFSPDGKNVVAGLWTSAVILDASTCQEEHVLDVKDSKHVEFSPDGTRFVTLSYFRDTDYIDPYVVHIWDSSTFQLLHKFKANRAAVSIEGTEILTISNADSHGRRQFQVLDISAPGTLLRTGQIMMAKSYFDYPLLIGFSSASMRFMIALQESVEIWDLSPESASKKVTLDECIAYGGMKKCGAMSPDGKLVAMVTSESGFEVGVFDASTGSRLFVLLHDRTVTALKFSYDRTRIASVSDNGNLYIWDTRTGTNLLKVLKPNSLDSFPSVAFTRDGSHIGLSLSGGTIQVWSLDDLAEVECDTQNGSLADDILMDLSDVAVSDDPKKIMSFNQTKVQMWDVTTRTVLMATSFPIRLYKAQMSGKGEIIVCHLVDDDHGSVSHLKVLNATTGNEMLHLGSKVNMRVRAVAISHSGRKIALATDSAEGTGRVEIWSSLDSAKEAEFVVGKSNAYDSSLNFSDDERYIVADFHGSPIAICDMQTGNTQNLIESKINEHGCFHLLSVDGNELAICRLIPERGSTLCEVWDISSGKRQNRFELSWWLQNHDDRKDGYIYSFGFSSKGKKFVAACKDGYIRVWSAVSNKIVIDVMLVYCSPNLRSIALSRDDKLVVIGSKDGSVQVWDLDDDSDMAEKYPWALTKSGWITSLQNTTHRLMWVSDTLKVKQPRNTSFISGPGYGSVDFSGAMIGEDWEKCHSSRNSVGKSK